MQKAKKSSLKTAIILSGGGARGAFEAGALKIIMKKIIPDIIIGTSIGSVNGAALALGKDTQWIEDYWLELKKKDALRLNPVLIRKFYKSPSLYSQKFWKKKVIKLVGKKKFSQCKIPLYIHATRLDNGEGVFFNRALISEAIMASTALPPLFPPYTIGKKRYLDGSMSGFIASKKAISLKAKQLIIINLGYTGKKENVQWNMSNLSTHAIDLLIFQSFKHGISLAREKKVNIVEIDLKQEEKVSISDFHKSKELIAMGEFAAKKVLRKIKM